MRWYSRIPPGACRNQIEQTRVASDVPHQRLSLHLLAQVGVDVTAQYRRAVQLVCVAGDTRKRTACKDAVELERAPKLPREQRVQVVQQDAAGQEIGVPAAQPARARSREQEPEAPRLPVNPVLDGVKQLRDTLNLVDENRANARLRRRELPFEAARIGDKVPELRRDSPG